MTSLHETLPRLRLHDYFRSTSSWRLRIVLNLKGLEPERVFHHLRRGEQRAPDYLTLNPQGLVPTLEVDGRALTQSLAICEWVNDIRPEPALLPVDAFERGRVRAFCLAIACEIHPLCNLRVLERLRSLDLPEDAVKDWIDWVIVEGLASCETLLAEFPGPFCFGATPTLADACLVPQLGNARRFGCDVTRVPRLLAAEAACNELPAFRDASPGRQPDAE